MDHRRRLLTELNAGHFKGIETGRQGLQSREITRVFGRAVALGVVGLQGRAVNVDLFGRSKDDVWMVHETRGSPRR
jgi:hypothetical protein